MAIIVNHRPTTFNPWFKNMFTGETFLLYSYEKCYGDGKEIIGVTLTGIDSRMRKRRFEVNIPNTTRSKFVIQFNELESIAV